MLDQTNTAMITDVVHLRVALASRLTIFAYKILYDGGYSKMGERIHTSNKLTFECAHTMSCNAARRSIFIW